ncbi:MAG: YdeI/OmpD-associated family protein [Bacteroidota bacterium]
MIVGETLYVWTRTQWRAWLSKNHAAAKEIWLIYYKKESGKKRISYNDAVEEALCYGWIDSTAKSRDKQSWVQRFSPRRPKSNLSELNKERMRVMIKAKKMTKAGLLSVAQHLTPITQQPKRFVFPKDILLEIKKNPTAWKHYQRFPLNYRRIRIAWIDDSRIRPDEYTKRLRYFISMTEKNKRFGTVQ